MTDYFSKIDIDVMGGLPGITPYSGLIPLLKMCDAMDLSSIINRNLHVRTEKGYKDSDHVLSLVAMQIVEGVSIDDLSLFKEKFNLSMCPFNIPSPSAARDFIKNFHNADEEGKQKQGHAYIPKENEHLAGFQKIHAHIFQTAYNANPKVSITLDQDATFIPTHNKNALFNYLKEQSYAALNTFCSDYDVMVGTQYRDGNVPAGYGQLDELKRVLSQLPVGITKVSLRSDSAGYQEGLIKYCMDETKDRFGEIKFTISCDVGEGFKEACRVVGEKDWHPVEREVIRDGEKVLEATGQEWADVPYVPCWAGGKSKNAPECRFIAIRERFEGKYGDGTQTGQMAIPELIEGMEAKNANLKELHLTNMGGTVHKVFGIVTNMFDEEGGRLVLWHHKRCGKAEEAHRVLKEELAGGHVASGRFGSNAACWNIAVMAFSLMNVFKRNFLPKECEKSRPKTLRYKFFTMIGRIVKHGRKIVLKVYAGQASEWYRYARDRLMGMCASAG